MLKSAFLFIGSIAFVWTVITLVAAVYADSNTNTGDGLATISGVVGFVLWGVWTFGTLNIIVIDGGISYRYPQPSLTIVGIMLALVPGYIALTGPIELVSRVRDTRMDDV